MAYRSLVLQSSIARARTALYKYYFDVTEAVGQWAKDINTNHGLLVVNSGANTWGVFSQESGATEPQIVVHYRTGKLSSDHCTCSISVHWSAVDDSAVRNAMFDTIAKRMPGPGPLNAMTLPVNFGAGDAIAPFPVLPNDPFPRMGFEECSILCWLVQPVCSFKAAPSAVHLYC